MMRTALASADGGADQQIRRGPPRVHLSQLVDVQRGSEDWLQLGIVREARPTVEYAR